MPDLMTPLDGRPWSQERMARQAPTWVPSGVIGTPQPAYGSGPAGLSFAVAGSVITVALSLFRSIGRGFLYERTGQPWQTGQPASGSVDTGDQSLATPAYALNGNSNPRIDRLVLRRDLAAGQIYPFIIQGTPSATPSPPALVQNETGIWDTPLHRWQLAGSNSTAISNIVDERVWVDPDGHGGGAAPAMTAISLRAGWSAVANHTPGVFLDASGLVCLYGWISNQNAFTPDNTQVMFDLPAGFRPSVQRFQIVPVNQSFWGVQVNINSDGTVVAARSNGQVSAGIFWDLEQVRFRLA